MLGKPILTKSIPTFLSQHLEWTRRRFKATSPLNGDGFDYAQTAVGEALSCNRGSKLLNHSTYFYVTACHSTLAEILLTMQNVLIALARDCTF